MRDVIVSFKEKLWFNKIWRVSLKQCFWFILFVSEPVGPGALAAVWDQYQHHNSFYLS